MLSHAYSLLNLRRVEIQKFLLIYIRHVLILVKNKVSCEQVPQIHFCPVIAAPAKAARTIAITTFTTRTTAAPHRGGEPLGPLQHRNLAVVVLIKADAYLDSQTGSIKVPPMPFRKNKCQSRGKLIRVHLHVVKCRIRIS